MDLQEYTQFVIERSTLRPDDIDFNMLRAACGLAAEMQELILECERRITIPEAILSEEGDVAFWCTALKYWIEKAGLTTIRDPFPPDTVFSNGAAICDAVEKYTRKRDLSKLQSMYDSTCRVLALFPQKVIDMNVAKLTVNPRGITNAA
jgi:hypothetical protein